MTKSRYSVSLECGLATEVDWLANCANKPKSKILHSLIYEALTVRKVKEIFKDAPCYRSAEDSDAAFERFKMFLTEFLFGSEDEFIGDISDEMVENLCGLLIYLLDEVMPEVGVIESAI